MLSNEMPSYKISITTTLLLFLGFFSMDIHLTYAADGVKSIITETDNSQLKNTIHTKDTSQKNEDIKSVDESKNIIKLKQDIDESIVDFIVVPKAKQLIKDISIKFNEQYPKPEDRIIAYETIKKRLILRKNRVDLLKISDKGKYILQEFLDQMIDLLDKKIADLS